MAAKKAVPKVGLSRTTARAQRDEAQAVKKITDAVLKAAKIKGAKGKAQTLDSFTNFAQKYGVGADNPLSTASYGFNPITRVRTVLEWIHRGSWLGGVAIDLVADDMVRAWVEIEGDQSSEDNQKIETEITKLGIKKQVSDVVRWARLYGGAIGVLLIEGQDPSTPLRIETVGPKMFRGMMVLDRWMCDPDLEDLVTELGPHFGLPKYYRVWQGAAGLRNQRIHYTRVIRMIGVELPYMQRVMENLWGISILERLYDRMIAFDSASTGAAQLVYRSWIRTYAIKDLRDIVASGGPPLEGLVSYVNMMRRFQGTEGITLLDAEDKMETMQSPSFSGLNDALMQFAQQLSGALQIPLPRLFGTTPGGLNSPGDHELRMYYDGILQQQNTHLLVPTTTIHRLAAQSLGIKVPENFGVRFKNLWQLTEKERAEIAETIGRAVGDAEDRGLITQQGAMRELVASSDITGVFTNITEEDIDGASTELPPPGTEALEEEGKVEKDLAEADRDDDREKPVKDAAYKGADYALIVPKNGKFVLVSRLTSKTIGEPHDDRDSALLAKRAYDKQALDEYIVKRKAGGDRLMKARDKLNAIAGMKFHHDIDFHLENAKGSLRRGKMPDGTNWEAQLQADYGEVWKTKGADGDRLDMFVGPNPASKKVYIIHQQHLEGPNAGKFDEHKIMAGFDALSDALAAYVGSYSDGRGQDRIMKLDTTTIDMFKAEWLK